MESITQLNQLKNNIDSISLNLYIIESNLHLIEMLNTIHDKIIELLSDKELIKRILEISTNISELKNILTILNPKLHKEVFTQNIQQTKVNLTLVLRLMKYL